MGLRWQGWIQEDPGGTGDHAPVSPAEKYKKEGEKKMVRRGKKEEKEKKEVYS